MRGFRKVEEIGMPERDDNPGQGQPQAFAPFPAPAGGGSTDPPSWAAPAPRPRRRRQGLFVTLAVVLTAVLVTAVVVITARVVSGDGPAVAGQASNNAAEQEAAPPAAAPDQQAPAAQAEPPPNVPVGSSAEGDLRQGAVFLMSNDADANEVVAFSRKDDGTLREVGRYPTGGEGSGSFEESSQGLVLGTADGEASPVQNVDQAELLFVSNAGSGTISVFRVGSNGLELIGQTPSGGKRPVSLTVNNGLLYVLNSGESDRRLVLGPNTVLDNCTHGDLPSVTGFRINASGNLTPIEKSTRTLTGRPFSGCAQVSFTPDGRKLVVTERFASVSGQTKEKKGAINVFDVRFDGLLGARRVIDPSGVNPFGFNYLKDGTLIVTESNGATANPGASNVTSYQVNADGSLRSINGSVANGQTDSCWVAVTEDQKTVFISSAFGGGSVSSYRVRDDGGLELLHPLATAPDGQDATKDLLQDGVSDLALSRDSKYFYQLNSIDGTLWVFRVEPDGLLSHVETHQVFELAPFGEGGEAAPFGISAW
jgi:6-phosphogluconolactonase